MSFDTVRRDIFKRIGDNWAVTPIGYQGHEDSMPQNQDHIFVSIIEGAVNRINVGQPAYFRHTGIVDIEIFTKGQGTSTGRQHAATLAALFRDQQINGIYFFEPELFPIGRDGQYFQFSLTIPYRWDGVY